MPGGNLVERLSTLSASATDDDGVVTVTVTGPGVVTGLRLDDRIQRYTGARLSAEILRTMRRAQATLAAQVSEAVDEAVGVDTEDGRVVLDGFTPLPAVSDDPPAPVMPAAPPFPSFANTPSLPHQAPGNGFESGRDSRAR